MRKSLLTLGLVALAGLTGCSATNDHVTFENPRLVGKISHFPQSFTQGLSVDQGQIIESTGIAGRSNLSIFDMNGSLVNSKAMDDSVFAEGSATDGKTIWLLSWQNHTYWAYDRNSLELQEMGTYEREGWGLTYLPETNRLMASDGSSTVYILNHPGLSTEASLEVTMDGAPVEGLNELEYVGDGLVAANVFGTADVVVFDAATGVVTQKLNFATIPEVEAKATQDPNYVLNGIARVDDDTWLLTGKHYDYIYQVDFDLTR